jgi:hypothetical protein
MKKLLIISFLFLSLLTGSCKKEPGEGGTSTLKGTIIERNYNNSFPVFYVEYGAQAEDVYIIYGDGTTSDNRTRTSYDGTYEFKYLNNGSYTIFVYSDDTNFVSPSPSGKIVIKENVEITSKKSEVTVPEMTIIRL